MFATNIREMCHNGTAEYYEPSTYYDYLILIEVLVVIIAIFPLAMFPIIILRTGAISTHFRFLLLLLWLSHFMMVFAQAVIIVIRHAANDRALTWPCWFPFDALNNFRIIHDVGFFMTTMAMFLLIYDRFLFTIFYKRAERRQKYFRIVTIAILPLGIILASYLGYEAAHDLSKTRDKLKITIAIANTLEGIACLFCAITYFRSRMKFRDSFSHVTLNTRYLLFESQELTFALIPVCIMAIILKNLSLVTAWIWAIQRGDPYIQYPQAFTLMTYYSINTINVTLSLSLLVRFHRLLWKRFKEIFLRKQEEAVIKSEKEQYKAYFEMMDKQWA